MFESSINASWKTVIIVDVPAIADADPSTECGWGGGMGRLKGSGDKLAKSQEHDKYIYCL